MLKSLINDNEILNPYDIFELCNTYKLDLYKFNKQATQQFHIIKLATSAIISWSQYNAACSIC